MSAADEPLDRAGGAPSGPAGAGVSGLPDLHRHLDGSLRPETAYELAAALGVEAPAELLFRPRMGLDEALTRFSFTLALLQRPAAIARVAAEICEDARADGVTTLELRFAPHLHRGAPLADVVDAALEGAAGRAGLLLCALYGDDPALLHELIEVAAPRPGVVGLDLAGSPQPGHLWRLRDYEGAFREAARRGLGVTIHAGEGRPPAEIRVAVERLGARRIGHGTTLLDDPSLIDLLRDRCVTIEACLTSNLHVGAIADVMDHPLARWLDLGVAACVCTDNTLFSAVTASGENAVAARLPGMTPAKLARAAACGHAAAFAR